MIHLKELGYGTEGELIRAAQGDKVAHEIMRLYMLELAIRMVPRYLHRLQRFTPDKLVAIGMSHFDAAFARYCNRWKDKRQRYKFSTYFSNVLARSFQSHK